MMISPKIQTLKMNRQVDTELNKLHTNCKVSKEIGMSQGRDPHVLPFHISKTFRTRH